MSADLTAVLQKLAADPDPAVRGVAILLQHPAGQQFLAQLATGATLFAISDTASCALIYGEKPVSGAASALIKLAATLPAAGLQIALSAALKAAQDFQQECQCQTCQAKRRAAQCH